MNILRKTKQEKGSITLYVLVAMLFFLAIGMVSYMLASSRIQTQNDEIMNIKENYEKDLTEDRLEEIYEEMTTVGKANVTFNPTGDTLFLSDGGTVKLPDTTIKFANLYEDSKIEYVILKDRVEYGRHYTVSLTDNIDGNNNKGTIVKDFEVDGTGKYSIKVIITNNKTGEQQVATQTPGYTVAKGEIGLTVEPVGDVIENGNIRWTKKVNVKIAYTEGITQIGYGENIITAENSLNTASANPMSIEVSRNQKLHVVGKKGTYTSSAAITIDSIDSTAPKINNVTLNASDENKAVVSVEAWDQVTKAGENVSSDGGCGLGTYTYQLYYIGKDQNGQDTYNTVGEAISSASDNYEFNITDWSKEYVVGVRVADRLGNVSEEVYTERLAIATNYRVAIGTDEYYTETLQEAFNLARDGATIQLLKDYTDVSVANLNGKSVTFNNNEHILTKDSNSIIIEDGSTLEITGTGIIQTTSSIDLIVNNGTLNVTHTGTIENKNNEQSSHAINNTGTLRLGGNGTIKAYQDVITTSGTLNMSSGTVTASATNEIYGATIEGTDNATVTITGGTVKHEGNESASAIYWKSSGELTISDSAQIIVNPKENTGGNGILNTSGGNVIIAGGAITVTGGNNTNPSCAVNNNSQGVVTITSGTLNGANKGIINTTGTVNISGGTVTSNGQGIDMQANGVVEITGGTVTGGENGIYNILGRVSVSGGEITGTSGEGISNRAGGVVEVSNTATITGNGNGISSFGNTYNSATLNITGGTITSTNGHGVANDEYGTTTITGGTITAKNSGVYSGGSDSKEGRVYISGGTITGDANGVFSNGTSAFTEITGGEFKGNNGNGIDLTAGTVTVGKQEDELNITNPSIVGSTYGINISGGTAYFYNGVFKGQTSGINGTIPSENIRVNHKIATDTEEISGTTYNTAYLTNQTEVTFDANGGTVGTASKEVRSGASYGELPTPTRTGYDFNGWLNSVFGEGNLLTSTRWNANQNVTVNKTDNYVEVIYNQENSTPGYIYRGANNTFEVGKTYTVSAYVKGIDSSTLKYWIYGNTGTFTGISLTEFTKVSTTFTFETPTQDFILLGNSLTIIGSGFQIKWLQVEEGNSTTDFEITADTVVTKNYDHKLIADWKPYTYTVSFNANLNSRLPSAYQEVEYIESNGTQYINTGVKPTNTLNTRIVYTDTSATSSNYVLGSRSGAAGSAIYYGLVGSEKGLTMDAYYNSASGNNLTSRIKNEKYDAFLQIEHDDTQGYRMHTTLNATKAGNSYEVYSPYYANGITATVPNIFVFAIKAGQVHKGMQLHSLQFYDGETLIHDFVPCYRISDDVAGLYDIVGEQFVSSATNSNFTYGANVSQEYEIEAQQFTYDVAQRLNDMPFTVQGYTFLHWNTKQDDSGRTFEDKEEVLNLTSEKDENVDLYAIWKINTYTVSFDGNGGTGSMQNMNFEYGEYKDLTENTFTRQGYHFKEWNTKADGTGNGYTNKQRVQNLTGVDGEEIVLYAQWEINKYSIEYNYMFPEGYQEVEYIENNGTQFINTGVKPTNTLRTEMIYMDTAAEGSNYVLGSRVGEQGSEIYYGLVGNSGNLSIDAYYNSKNQNSFGVTREANKTYHAILDIEHDSNGYRMVSTLTDVDTDTTYEAQSPYYPNGITDEVADIYVFSIKGEVVHTHKGMRLYLLKMYDNGELIRNFIPSTRTSDGAIGLYDMVNDVFYVSENNRAFTKGADGANEYHEKINQQFTYGVAQNLTANSIPRTGYEFTGWNTKVDGTGTHYDDEQEILNLTENHGDVINLYAQWTGAQSTVTFNAGNDATIDTSEKSVTYNENYGELPVPTRTGYGFEGWFTSAEGGERVTAETKVTNPNDHVLYAHWTANQYDVVFQKNGLPSGYTEVEYIESSGGQYILTDIVPSNTTGIYARILSKNTASDLVYFGSKGTGNSRLWTGNVRDKIYTGWNSLPGEGNRIPTDNETINTIKVNYLNDRKCTVNDTDVVGFTNLPGLSSDNTYPIAIFGGNNEGNINYRSSIRLYEFTVSSEDRISYKLIPCYRTSDGVIGLYDISHDVFYTNSGSGDFTKGADVETDNVEAEGIMANQRLTYGISQNLTANTYTRQGYSFAGWNTLPGGTGTGYTDGESVSNLTAENNGKVILYAQWEAKTYTVTFDVGAGATVSPDRIDVTYDSLYGELPVPVKTGYTFLGWYTTRESGELITATTQVTITDNQTLYAHWIANVYDVVFNQVLPEEYQEVEYVGSTGAQYILTNIVPTNSTGIYARVSSANVTSDVVYFGSKGEDDSRLWIGNNEDKIYYGWNSNMYSQDVVTADTVYTIKMNYLNNRIGTLNDEFLRDINADLSETNTYPIAIFGGNSAGTVGYKASINLYGFKITEGLGIAHDFVPCYRKADNVIGMYDMMTGIFYTNNGTGTFSKGADVDNRYHANKNQLFTYDVGQSLSINTYTIGESNFIGWNTSADGTGQNYTDGENVSNLTADNNTVFNLYAQWELDVSMELSPDSGTVVAGNQVTSTISGTNYGTISVASSNSEVATGAVDGTTLTITGVAEGTATITLTSSVDPSVTAIYTVTVQPANYSITNSGVTTYYTTLVDAHEAAVTNGGDDNGGTIVVVADTVTDSSIVNITKNIKLDSNGKVLNRTATITIDNGAVLTIAGTGTIQTSEAIDLFTNNGTLNVTHTGTIQNTNQGSNLAIKNAGTLSLTGNGSITAYNSTIDSTAGSISMSAGTVSVSGTGVLYGATIGASGTTTANITGGTIRNEGNEYASAIYWTASGTLNVGNDTVIVHTMKAGTNSGCAIQNASTTGGVVSITGGTYSSDGNSTIFNNASGTINISGGTIGGTPVRAIANSSTGTINISGNPLITGQDSGVQNNGTGTITVTGGTITGNSGDGVGIRNSSNSIINVSGSNTVITGAIDGIRVTSVGTVNVTGGTIVGQSRYGAYNSSTGTISIGSTEEALSITNPSVQGNTYGLLVGSGTAYFYNGIIKGQTAGINGTIPDENIRTGYSIVTGTEPIEEITYNTAYLAKRVNVTFNENNGIGTMSNQLFLQDVAQNITTNTFTRTGYHFTGWNTEANGSGTGYTDGQSVTLTADTTLYAQWEADEYTVTLDANGGQVNPSSTTQTYGQNYQNLYTPTREGYDFVGWNGKNLLDPTKGTEYTYVNASGTVVNWYNENLPWTTSEYIEIEGGKTYIFTPNSTAGGSARHAVYDENKNFIQAYASGAATIQAPANAKYIIVSYRSTSTNVQLEEGSTATEYEPYYVTTSTTVTQTKNHTLTARWTPSQYIVTFNNNTGTGTMGNQTYTHGVEQAITTNTFTKEGYTFTGWNTETDGSGTGYTDGQSISLTANITLYAQWEESTTISLSASSGTIVAGNNATVTISGTNYGTPTVTSSNSSVATGAISGTTLTVTGVSEGTATITVTSSTDTTKTATYNITVTAANYSITRSGVRTNYASLALAHAAASGGDTIKVENDVSDLTAVSITRNINLDTQTYVITRTSPITISSTGTLNLSGTGTIRNSSTDTIDNSGTLNITTAVNIYSYSNNPAIAVKDNGILDMSDGSVKGKNKGIQIESKASSAGTATISGGEVIVSSTYTASRFENVMVSSRAGEVGEASDNGTAILIGGEISTMQHAILNLYGGTVNGEVYGIEIGCADCNIGNQNDTLNNNNPIVIGGNRAIITTMLSANVYFYNGILKCPTSGTLGTPVNIRSGCSVVNGTDVIGGVTYNTAYLEENPANLISFSVDGESYSGESGMTWEDWISSRYNTSYKEYTLDEFVDMFYEEHGINVDDVFPYRISDLRSQGVTKVVYGIFINLSDNGILKSGYTFLNDSGDRISYYMYVPYGESSNNYDYYLRYNYDRQYSNTELIDGADYEMYYDD